MADLKESLGSVVTYAKKHPIVAAGAIGAAGLAAYVIAKRGQTGTPSAQSDLGASGGIGTDSGVTFPPIPGLPVPTTPSTPAPGGPGPGGGSSGGSSGGSAGAGASGASAPVVDLSTGLAAAIPSTSSEMTAAAVKSGNLGLLSTIRSAYPDVYMTPQQDVRRAQRAGFTMTPASDVLTSVAAKGVSSKPISLGPTGMPGGTTTAQAKAKTAPPSLGDLWRRFIGAPLPKPVPTVTGAPGMGGKRPPVATQYSFPTSTKQLTGDVRLLK